VHLLLSRAALARGLALVLVVLTAPAAAWAQACPCDCATPEPGASGADGSCQCPCAPVPIPGITAETLSGPPKPPKAGGPAPSWQVDPFFDDNLGDPFWGPWFW
jgi:hypothetical protein